MNKNKKEIIQDETVSVQVFGGRLATRELDNKSVLYVRELSNGGGYRLIFHEPGLDDCYWDFKLYSSALQAMSEWTDKESLPPVFGECLRSSS